MRKLTTRTPETARRSLKRIRLPLVSLTLLSLTLISCGNNGEALATEEPTSVIDLKNAKGSALQNNATSVAQESNASVVAALQNNLISSGIEQKVISAVPTDMPNMYWATAEGLAPFFTDEKGTYVIQGQVIKVGGAEPVNISARLQGQVAAQKLSQVAKDDMIIYPAQGETKAVVYAFTDADCGYCRKLHSEMNDIVAQGVEVRYLAWPRSEETYPKMESIWCSDDRNSAMNTAKAGGAVAPASCDNPVQEQVQLGFSLGVSGTPAIFTESGVQIGGYLPAPQLVQAAIANQ